MAKLNHTGIPASPQVSENQPQFYIGQKVIITAPEMKDLVGYVRLYDAEEIFPWAIAVRDGEWYEEYGFRTGEFKAADTQLPLPFEGGA